MKRRNRYDYSSCPSPQAAAPCRKALARPRELFGESLPELLLLTAVVAAVVSAVFALNGAG